MSIARAAARILLVELKPGYSIRLRFKLVTRGDGAESHLYAIQTGARLDALVPLDEAITLLYAARA
jgi:hypothetical protein